MTKLNNILTKFAHKLYHFSTYAVSGALLFGFFQFPFSPLAPKPLINSTIGNIQSSLIAPNVIPQTTIIKDVFFGAESAKDVTQATIDKQVAFVSSRDAFPASLAVVEKHADSIMSQADVQNVPQDVALGVALLENGGSDTAVSSAGALGVFQLMPGTARNLGLTVNKKSDERKDPEKNIEAGVTYLAQNFERFGDWGLATWAYHAGEGNVAKALKIYAKANNNIDLPGVGDATALKNYVEKYGITIHKLLSDTKVKEFTKKLHDDSAGYPYKVVATAKLFRDSQ